MEALDGIPDNARLLKEAGVVVATHSDSPVTVQTLGVEAAKLVGTGLDPARALETITLDPARMLGVERWVGSITPGKHADLVLHTGDPLDVTSVVQQVWIDGQSVYRRASEVKDAR
jgi:imidazolonepropionase-like amidohydrolase